VDNFELREEIRHGGRNYFLQTSFLPSKEYIQTSFFANGNLFDTVIEPLDGKLAAADLRRLTKDIHRKNKSRFRLLLDAQDIVNKAKRENCV